MDHGEIKQLCPLTGFAIEFKVSDHDSRGPEDQVERWPVVGLALCADGTVQLLASDALGEVDLMRFDGSEVLMRDDRPLFRGLPATPKLVAPKPVAP